MGNPDVPDFDSDYHDEQEPVARTIPTAWPVSWIVAGGLSAFALVLILIAATLGQPEQKPAAPREAAAYTPIDEVARKEAARLHAIKYPYPRNLNITITDVLECLSEEDGNPGFGPIKFGESTTFGKTIYIDDDAGITFIPTLDIDDELATVELSCINNGQPGDDLKQRRFMGAARQILDMMGSSEDELFDRWMFATVGALDSPSLIDIDMMRFRCVRASAGLERSVIRFVLSRKPEGERLRPPDFP